MKLKTVRIQRSRPSALALALALMLTMLSVYLISLTALPDTPAETAAASAPGRIDLRMEGLNTHFICAFRSTDLLEARVMAAHCAQKGGAGLVLEEGGEYIVVQEACAAAPGEDAVTRSCGGLTLEISGPAGEITALSDGISFLRTQATETAALASALESGSADAASLRSLLGVYHTQGKRALEGLRAIWGQAAVAGRLADAVEACVKRLDAAIASPDPGKLRLIHAAACADWIKLIHTFIDENV